MHMKTLIKRRLAVSVAVLMLALAGCGGGTPAPAGDSATAKASATSSGEVTKLTVEVFDRALENGTNPADNFWTDWIKENALADLNIEVNFVTVPRSEEVPQLNVLMAGGSPPDIVFTYNYSVAYNYYRQGGLADLTDYMGTVGQNLSSFLGEDVLNGGKFEGRQFLIPAKRVARNTYNTFMRKDWLDKLNMPVPTTLDEFYNALVAFKEKNPGNVTPVIPYMMNAKATAFDNGPILDAFTDIYSISDEDRFALAVGQDASAQGMLYPGYKEGIRFLNKMYNDGLIDPEFPLHPSREDTEDIMSRGTVGAYTANYEHPIRQQPGVYTNLVANVPDAEWVTLDCFENQYSGEKMRQKYSPYGAYNFVPASSKNVEGAVRYLNWLSTDAVRNWIVCGEEGVNHTLDENGVPVMISLSNHPQMMNSPNNLDYAIIVNGIDLGDPEKNVLAIAKSYEEQYVDWFVDAYDKSLKGLVFNPIPVPFDTEAQYVATLNNKRHEITAAAITAPVDQFDSVYDTGIQEWLSIGGQACVDERRAYFKENPGYADNYETPRGSIS